MIDLSFLTEEEQETIMKVLQRDAALKRTEEERVRHLPEKIKDDQQLKNMSGQWFYEAKAKRHREKIHGADVIRASMRKRRLPGPDEPCKGRDTGAKESWVNNVNKDALLPPEVAGIVEEPEEGTAPANPSASMANPASAVIDMPWEKTRKSALSPAKQRKNPFNSTPLPEDPSSEQTKSEHSKNGSAGLSQIEKEGELSDSKEKLSTPDTSIQKLAESKETLPAGPSVGSQIKPPIPKARKLIYKSNDSKPDLEQSFPRQRTDSVITREAPRGILKRNSSSSSTDSENLRLNHNLEPKGKIVSPGLIIHERISEKEHSLEDDSSSNSPEPSKHVRFSTVKGEPPQSSGLVRGREVGEFSVLESDRWKNGTEDAGDGDEFQDDHQLLQDRKPLPFHQPASSSTASKNETYQPVTPGSVPNDGLHPHSDVVTAGPQSTDISLTIDKHQDKSAQLTRLKSELSKNPADELSHGVEPDASQALDRSSRDHQQGKLPLLTAVDDKTSSHSGSRAMQVRKTADDSILKVLDWFNRSSHSDDRKSTLQHPQGIESQNQTDSKSQTATPFLTDDTSLNENDSKIQSPIQVKLKSLRSDATLQVEGQLLLSGSCQKKDANIKSRCANLSQESALRESLGVLQPSETNGAASQRNKNWDCVQGSEGLRDGNGVSPPSGHFSYNVLKGLDAEVQVPRDSKNIGSLGSNVKNRGNSEVNFDSLTAAQDPKLKTESKGKGGNTSLLQASVETSELPWRAITDGPPQKKPEVQLQEKVYEAPKNQVLRERYKRVSERISFWEGERTAAKVSQKEPTSSCSQEQASAKGRQPGKSQGVNMDSSSTDQEEYSQVIAKLVVLDEDDAGPHLSNFYSSSEPKETQLETSDSSKNYSSTDQSSKVSLFLSKINKPMERLPVADTSHYRRDFTLSVLQQPPNIGNEVHPPLEKDRFPIGESSANFKVMSLKERVDEPNAEQVYNPSQFKNLKKFWDLGANPNSKNNYEKNNSTTSQKKSVPFKTQKHKELSNIKSSEKNAHEVEALLGQKDTMAGEEMKKLSSKDAFQVLPDDTTFPLRTHIKSTDQLAGNESPKENMAKNMEWFVPPVILQEEKDYSDQEIQESVVKTSVVSKDYKDTFNDSLQKLLSEASSPVIQHSDGKVHRKQVPKPGVSENWKWPQKIDITDNEEEARGPAEIPDEHVLKSAASPKAQQDTLAVCLDKLLKETSGISPSLVQTKLDPVISKTNTQLEEDTFFHKRVTQNPHMSACQREKTPSPEGDEVSGDTVATQKAGSGEHGLNSENLLQGAADGSPPQAQPSHLQGNSVWGDVDSSSQDAPFVWDTHSAPWFKALSSEREISETVEKVVVPPKPVLNDINDALQRLLREASLSYPSGSEGGPEEMQAEFHEGEQAAACCPPPEAAVDIDVPERKNFHTVTVVPDKAQELGSCLVHQMSTSEQLLIPSVSPVAKDGPEQHQEVVEIVRETVIQPKLEFLEFNAILEKLLKETLETSPSKHEKDPEVHPPSELMGSAEAPRPVASEPHPEDIQETVEKVKAPSITKTAFDTGLEKLLKEMSEVPPLQLQLSRKEDAPERETSHSEQAGFLDTMPHFYWAGSGAPEMTDKIGVEPQANQCDKVLERDEAVIDLPVDLCDPASSVEISEIPQFYVDHEVKISKRIKPPEDRDREIDIPGGQGAFEEPGFEEAPKEISVSRNKESILLTDKETPTKISTVELMLASPHETKDKELGKEDLSDSEFSDGNTGSNAGSWRNTSSSEEEPSRALRALERSAARKMPSQSLEDFSSDASNQAKVDTLPEELVRSAENDQKAEQEPDTQESIPGISTVPSQSDSRFSNPDKLKRMSKSVPAFLQDETDDRETDTASESSYQLSRHKKSPGSLTNLSSSSGMTSLSSVSGSVMSVYSGDFGNLEVKGSVQFAVDYVESLKELHVFVAQCKDLAAADVKKQRSDPYVKTYLLPDKGKVGKKKTLVAKKTLNPVYNEILRYKTEKENLKTQKLNLSVWHRDTFKRNSFLGEVELDLGTWDWDNKHNKQLKWYPLKRKTAPIALEAENRGEMKLALQYVPEPSAGKKLPTTGEVHIWVKECLDLPLLRGSHLNSFVKCIILPDTSRKSRQKTRAVGKTNNPVFNHTMVYDGFRPEDLKEACVELTVWDHYKLTNQFLGGLRIGFGTGKSYGTEVDWMDSTSEEVALWEKMVNSPNTWVEAVLPLRMLLIAKISK